MQHFKSTFLSITVSLLLSACNSNQKTTVQDTTTDADTSNTIATPRQMCFQRLEGSANQDTTFLNLTIEGENVTGNLNHMPKEKDSRKGTISGKIKDNIITGLWSFMQEGMNDTLSVEFRLEKDILLQKSYGVDKSSGRQKLTDTSSFSIKYKNIPCI